MNNHDPWDADYGKRGRLWGGSAPDLPGLGHSDRILELGCGNGKTAAALARSGHRITALDSSPHAARLCTEACAGRAAIVIADVRKLPFRSGSFDVILAFHIAGHLLSNGRHLLAAEVLRLLAGNGRLLFRDFAAADFRYGKGAEIEPATFCRQTGISTHYFTEVEVRDLFCSFEVSSLETHRWNLRVNGENFPRAEIMAEFRKPGPLPQTLCSQDDLSY